MKTKFNPLPYGVWTTKDGTEILFSRSYHPLYRRKPGEPATPDKPRWVHDIARCNYFYDDGSYKSVSKQLRRIERDFVEGKPIELDQVKNPPRGFGDTAVGHKRKG
jgi:hypothetical protein